LFGEPSTKWEKKGELLRNRGKKGKIGRSRRGIPPKWGRKTEIVGKRRKNREA